MFWAGDPTSIAAGANALVDDVLPIGCGGDRTDGTVLSADCASDAIAGHVIVNQCLAAAGRAFSLKVGFVFMAKVLEGRHDGVGRRFCQVRTCYRATQSERASRFRPGLAVDLFRHRVD